MTGGPERTLRVTSTGWTLVIRSLLVSQASQCPVVGDRAAAVAASLASLTSQVAGLHPSLPVGISTHLVTPVPLANLHLLVTLNPLVTPLLLLLASIHPNLPHPQATTVVRIPHPQGTGQASPSMGRSHHLPLGTGQAPTPDLSPRVGSPSQRSRCEQPRSSSTGRGGSTARAGNTPGLTPSLVLHHPLAVVGTHLGTEHHHPSHHPTLASSTHSQAEILPRAPAPSPSHPPTSRRCPCLDQYLICLLRSLAGQKSLLLLSPPYQTLFLILIIITRVYPHTQDMPHLQPTRILTPPYLPTLSHQFQHRSSPLSRSPP